MENDMAKKVTRSRQWTKEELRMIKTLTREKTKMVIARKEAERKTRCMVWRQSWA
jgi:hypothetical protein